MERKHIYLISGLGSDERVFRYLNLSAYEVHYIQWIPPVKDETLKQYASRLLPQITTAYPTLIGLSMGGMIAVEIGKIIATEKIILISSAKYGEELPGGVSIFGKLKIHRFIPDFLLLRPNRVLYQMFGVHKRRHKVILRDVIRNTDPDFARWGMDAIMNWENREAKGTIIHIHGAQDRIIPIGNVQADYIIQEGGHSMVFQQPEKISGILNAVI